jgi:hypothetical protein
MGRKGRMQQEAVVNSCNLYVRRKCKKQRKALMKLMVMGPRIGK